MDEPIVRVAVPVPLRRCFDYLCPAPLKLPRPGQRVRVGFGRRSLVGVATGIVGESPLPRRQLRPLLEVIDEDPVVPESVARLIGWAADYYHHPMGEAWQAALPADLRRGMALRPDLPHHYRLTETGRVRPVEQFRRAPAQGRVMDALRAVAEDGLAPAAVAAIAPSARAIVKRFEAAGWVERQPVAEPVTAESDRAPELMTDQRRAVDSIVENLDRYAGHLLYGVTGSGKTEVYLNVIAAVVARGRQALVLIPEIALTPQLLARFEARFDLPIAVLHSGLTDAERHRAWWRSRAGEARIVIGTRSAVFTPLSKPGVIVVDEEHDLSYKQQDGFRYHARDLAVYRARLEQVPVVLGSATPSLESLTNVSAGRYAQLRLTTRARQARLPQVHLVDLRCVPAHGGLSKPVMDAIRSRIAAREQSLIFLNRRGFAPVLVCAECGWQAQCPRCDARVTLHKKAGRLRCHHCGRDVPTVNECPDCGASKLADVGAGTQKVEAAIEQAFPDATIVRIDRDNVTRKGDLEARLEQAHSGAADILVGTQLLAKGHDFPRVTLVAVLNADQGLFSVDFRAMEQLFQQIMQVAGRAGRGERPGSVLIQTGYPSHPQFEPLRRHDYSAFAAAALSERQAAQCPPFFHFALLRAESTQREAALGFMRFACEQGVRLARRLCGVEVMDPIPSPMEKRAGRYRAQLLLRAAGRAELHALLTPLLNHIEDTPPARRVRWSIDVDPMEMY